MTLAVTISFPPSNRRRFAFVEYDQRLGELLDQANGAVVRMQEQAMEFNGKAEELNNRLVRAQAQIQIPSHTHILLSSQNSRLDCIVLL